MSTYYYKVLQNPTINYLIHKWFNRLVWNCTRRFIWHSTLTEWTISRKPSYFYRTNKLHYYYTQNYESKLHKTYPSIILRWFWVVTLLTWHKANERFSSHWNYAKSSYNCKNTAAVKSYTVECKCFGKPGLAVASGNFW